ncbi:MAG: hypothetical protein EAZ08_12180 [Cytophagales bacterium]|nr:MAG: hypothetical protein EAZ08_12180 [Cytophagales bacterium]
MDDREHLHTLTEIRSLMERSSRFISLSGLSGISAGVCACVGVGVLVVRWGIPLFSQSEVSFYELATVEFIKFLLIDVFCVLISALLLALYFTRRKAKIKGLPFWDKSASRLLVNLFIPLAAGGIFSLSMIYHHFAVFIPATTLVFYGLALLNASKYTLHDIRALGLAEMALGLCASFLLGYSLLFWLIGFGILHIIYGTIMYFKYEK